MEKSDIISQLETTWKSHIELFNKYGVIPGSLESEENPYPIEIRKSRKELERVINEVLLQYKGFEFNYAFKDAITKKLNRHRFIKSKRSKNAWDLYHDDNTEVNAYTTTKHVIDYYLEVNWCDLTTVSFKGIE